MNIIKYPNNCLRVRSKNAEHFDNNLKDLVKSMENVLVESNGVGLSAVQIGLSLRIILIKCGNFIMPMINPLIIHKIGSKSTILEGCLSIPNFYNKVERYKSIRVSFYDATGKHFTNDYKGFIARIIQHECDHLEGVLIIDYENGVYKGM